MVDPTVYRNLRPKITTEFAPDGWCFEYRELHSYVPSLDWIIPHLQVMGEGLKEPSIELRAEGSYDDPDCTLYVRGLRLLTDEERATHQTDAERERARDLAELERLKAKYEVQP